MITRVKAVNLKYLERQRPGIELLLRTRPQFLNNNCLISCVPTAVELPDHPNWLRLDFDDIRNEDEIPPNPSPETQARVFAESHADLIINFIGRNQARAGKQVLFVNCLLGMSRSGAVATFVREMLVLDMVAFLSDNPCISASPMILNRLRKRWLEVH